MIILNEYQFTDGLRVYFVGNDKRNHVLCMPNDAYTFDASFQFDKIKTKTLNITYPRWNSIIQSNIKSNIKKNKCKAIL